jgi:AbrB family looped-hinge helix DNA binding protein
MRVTLDKAGRIVLPKKARMELELSAGDELELHLTGGKILLQPIASTGRLKQIGKILVLTKTGRIDTDVVELVRAARDERSRALSGMDDEIATGHQRSHRRAG